MIEPPTLPPGEATRIKQRTPIEAQVSVITTRQKNETQPLSDSILGAEPLGGDGFGALNQSSTGYTTKVHAYRE